MKRIGILTNYRVKPMHQRLKGLLEALREHYEVKLIPTRLDGPLRVLDTLTLHLCLVSNYPQHLRDLKDLDLLIVGDFTMLHYGVVARWRGMRVLYEAVDNSPHWHTYRLSRHLPLLGKLGFLPRLIEWAEKALVRAAAASVVVNSDALRDYFDGQATVLYYSSPFERIGLYNDPQLPPAFLYMGLISENKGARQIASLAARWGVPAFMFGARRDTDRRLLDYLKACPQVTVRELLSINALGHELESLMRRYFLIGLSLIRPVHFSYATQEADKDIDYLALGAPIVGNRRGPTWAKIQAGCGVLVEDEEAMGKLLSEAQHRARLAKTCREYYRQRYAFEVFRRRLLAVVEKVLR